MKERTAEEIADELHALNELLNRVPQTSAFGDDNHEAINAQIRVIRANMTRTQLLEEYEEDDPYILSAALDALSWLREDDIPVSVGWLELVEEPDAQAA